MTISLSSESPERLKQGNKNSYENLSEEQKELLKRNKQILEQYKSCIEKGDIENFSNLFNDDVIMKIFFEYPVNREEIFEENAVFEAFEKYHFNPCRKLKITESSSEIERYRILFDYVAYVRLNVEGLKQQKKSRRESFQSEHSEDSKELSFPNIAKETRSEDSIGRSEDSKNNNKPSSIAKETRSEDSVLWLNEEGKISFIELKLALENNCTDSALSSSEEEASVPWLNEEGKEFFIELRLASEKNRTNSTLNSSEEGVSNR